MSSRPLHDEIDALAAAIEPRAIAWRRDIHQHPELGNREFRTATVIAEHLEGLGIAVRRGVAHTGVIGVLTGGRPGGVVALRADMDALPMTEELDLPFASKERATYNGEDVGVMHSCGHDAHVAILMAVAEVLAAIRERIAGSVKFIFQPAEEGAPDGEEGGAELMVREGALGDPAPTAIFGLHVGNRAEVGQIGARKGSAMASVDSFAITVRGRQTHGAYPWLGVDPIVVAAQIVLALQTIPSRQLDVSKAPAILTIGKIHGGIRNNVIPDQVMLSGTIRALDEPMRGQIHERIRRTAEGVAASAGAQADVTIEIGYPSVWNEPALFMAMLPTLQRVAGETNVFTIVPSLGAEDFSFFQKEIPGLFFVLGTRPRGMTQEEAAPGHSPRFFVDETGLLLGVRALAQLAVDYLESRTADAGSQLPS
jgi:amidohydrolase